MNIKLIYNKNGWLAKFENDERVKELFGTDTIPTAFTKNASPAMVLQAIKKLNPGFTVEFAT